MRVVPFPLYNTSAADDFENVLANLNRGILYKRNYNFPIQLKNIVAKGETAHYVFESRLLQRHQKGSI